MSRKFLLGFNPLTIFQGDVTALQKRLGHYISMALHMRGEFTFFMKRHINSQVDELLCEVTLEQLDDGIRYLNTLISEQIRKENHLQSIQYIRDLLEVKRIDFIDVARRKQLKST